MALEDLLSPADMGAAHHLTCMASTCHTRFGREQPHTGPRVSSVP